MHCVALSRIPIAGVCAVCYMLYVTISGIDINFWCVLCAQIAGYIVHDGEGGLRLDRAQAVVLFKLAVLAESREAARILAWVFSTGQF